MVTNGQNKPAMDKLRTIRNGDHVNFHKSSLFTRDN